MRRPGAAPRRSCASATLSLLAITLLLARDAAAQEPDPEAPEVIDCEVPHNESRADQCLFINDPANNVRPAPRLHLPPPTSLTRPHLCVCSA